MQFLVTNPLFGDEGPWEAESPEALCKEREALFRVMAHEITGKKWFPGLITHAEYEVIVLDLLKKEFLDCLEIRSY